jgi:hypothetical protein
MPPNRKHFSSSPPPSYTRNPWNPPSLSSELRKSFKTFCATENIRRAQRGEVAFCTPDGRDRAFEKLIRLARGEEDMTWDGAEWEDEEEWVEDEDEDMEIVEEEKKKTTNGVQNKTHERKDSKEVAVDGDDVWRKTAMLLGFDKVRLGAEQGVEYMENMMNGKMK